MLFPFFPLVLPRWGGFCDFFLAQVRHERTLNSDAKQIEEETQRRIQRELRGAVVLAVYNQRIWRIDGVDFAKTPASTFDKDGRPVSFAQYVYGAYGTKVVSVKAGLLVNLPKKTTSKRGPIYLLPELCHLTGISDQMRSNIKLMRALADRTRLTPSSVGFLSSSSFLFSPKKPRPARFLVAITESCCPSVSRRLWSSSAS